MSKVIAIPKINLARIQFVPRRLLSALTQKIRPVVSDEELPSTTNTNTVLPDSLPSVSSKNMTENPSVSSKHMTENPSIGQITDDENDKLKSARSSLPNVNKLKSARLSSSNDNKLPLSSTSNTDNLKLIKDSGRSFSNWYNNLTFKQILLFKSSIVALIILGAAVGVVLPVYFFVIRQISSQSSSTNVSVSVCSNSTCIGQETPYRTSMITVLYPFDGNTEDLSGYNSGTAIGAPGFTPSAYVNQAISLTSTSQQYVQIPNVNLSKQSFTLETWIYPQNGPILSTDYAIFGQCDSNMICLSLSLRNGRITLSFDAMNNNSNLLIGTSLITSNWNHITVVYDATRFQQRIYVDGKIDAVSRGIVNSYQGTTSGLTTNIGKSSSYAYPNSYFYGRIDHFTISAGVARSFCEIYNDASILVYYPFDTNGTYNDYSANLCNGVTSGTTALSVAVVNQAISFTSNTSYFQSQCFPRMRGNDQSFSFSLWVNPTSIGGGGSLVHISSNSMGNGTCYDLLVFTANGNLVYQWITTTPTAVGVQGPVIPTNTWTHVALVYDSSNGVRLYINGQFSSSSPNTGGLSLGDTNNPWYMTLGNISPSGSSQLVNCLNGSIPISPGAFLGGIDEFRVYNRALDGQEICVLANQ